jgi:hypothetical protein
MLWHENNIYDFLRVLKREGINQSGQATMEEFKEMKPKP